MTKRIMHNWVAQIIAGGIAGTVAGFIVYEVTRLTGRSLYMLIGGIAGVVLVFAVQRFWSTARRTVQLTEVTLTLPVVSELKFVVDDEARRVAWQLYVEIATRVSTQPLGDGEGFIREALTSLYGLFGATRNMLKASRPSVAVPGNQTVEYLAVTMLNDYLRPFLSKWHPRLSVFEKANPDAEESTWPENADCRDDLRGVQVGLTSYAINFANLAGVPDPEKMIASGHRPTG